MNEVTAEVTFPVEFYDVDSMQVVWHGNYVKYMEKARCALLDKIGFGYLVMAAEHFAFPVTEVKVKYVRSLRFGEQVRAIARLYEWETCLKIKYEFYNAATGALTTKAESTQMAVNMDTGESLFACPPVFVQRVEALLSQSE